MAVFPAFFSLSFCFLPLPSSFSPSFLLSSSFLFRLKDGEGTRLLRELLGYFLKNHRTVSRLICIFGEHPYLGSNAKAQLRASRKSAWG